MKKAREFCCSEQGRTSAFCKCTIFALVLSLKIVIFLNYTPEVLRQGRYEDLCIRYSEIKDMAVRLQPVSMIFWNLPTVTSWVQYVVLAESAEIYTYKSFNICLLLVGFLLMGG